MNKETKEKKARYYQENHDRLSRKASIYYQENRKKILQKSKEYYLKNCEERKAYNQKYNEIPEVKIRIRNYQRRKYLERKQKGVKE